MNNKASLVAFIFMLIVATTLSTVDVYGQRNSSRRNTTQSKPAPTQSTPQQPAQQQVIKSDIPYDFSKLRSSDNFRNTPWGATKEQVLAVDDSPRKEVGGDYLVLTGILGDVNVDITYFFWRGHFIKGTYVSTDSFNDYGGYLEKYIWFKDLMVKKYGQPKIDIASNWNNVSLKNKPDRWLTALSQGHVEHNATWQKDNIVIQIKLAGINGKPIIKMEYFIDNFDTEMQQVDDTDILRDL
ncbi:hypothetical protein EP331_09380 [bacterium]|nr:MAG: hypothetical protein EP331_09380 [bacterium]